MTTTRTAYLLAAIRDHHGPITTKQAQQILATSPFSSHRNSARKALRTLTRTGHLTTDDSTSHRTYLVVSDAPTTTPPTRTGSPGSHA
ncbi:hypothetical protein [Streptomyces sp. NPDC090026]|uniref:hypothetical protein n=1 Tax=Streptomyces sp. NPDC090026 TaxID=3365923 RepID=UPI003803BE9F